ncbi:MAG: LPS export ABC transporter periplasmic protein LptC [Proteobacteria bacterium]|nr:LPS export ABC transporter periplasmic protein LptC [Pseudomonadota bacterium]
MEDPDPVRSRARGRTVLAAAVLAAILLSLLTRTAGASEVRISGFSFVQETGRGPWTLEAQNALLQEGERVILEDVSARLADPKGEEVGVTAQRGWYDSAHLILELEGQVRARRGTVFFLAGERMTWDQGKGTLRVQGNIEMTGLGILVMGESAVYNTTDRMLLFTGGVRAILDIKGEKP